MAATPIPSPRPAPPRRAAWALCLVALAVSCASYNRRTEGARRDFESGRFEEAIVAYAEDDTTGSAFLAGAEAGMAALAAGYWEQAVEHLGRAAEAVHEIEAAALVSPASAGELIASWTLNETFTDYHGEGYERAMLHACLGLAYLAQGMVEDLHVETRLADQLLTSEQELYDSDYRAGGLAHFLSAVAYELAEEYDQAYIDYKRLEAKDLGGELVGRSLVRLARWLGRDDELPQWESRFGADESPPHDAARIVVVAGVGLGGYKEEARLDIPTPDGFLSWAVPTFQSRPQRVTDLILDAGPSSVRTVVIEDVARVGDKNLEDRLAWLAAKSTVRTLIKREMREALRKEHGPLGALAGDLLNVLTERADLRAWRTLPDTWQAARLFVEPGVHELILEAVGGERASLGTFELEAGETMFVLARTLGPRLYAHPIGGRPVEVAPPRSPLESGPRRRLITSPETQEN